MPNYVVHADQRIVLAQLTRFTGETVEAEPGDVVQLHPDVPEDAIASYIESGHIEATSDAATPWPRSKPEAVQEDPSVAALAKSARAEQRAADKKAKADAILEAERVAAEAAVEQAAEAERIANEQAAAEQAAADHTTA